MPNPWLLYSRALKLTVQTQQEVALLGIKHSWQWLLLGRPHKRVPARIPSRTVSPPGTSTASLCCGCPEQVASVTTQKHLNGSRELNAFNCNCQGWSHCKGQTEVLSCLKVAVHMSSTLHLYANSCTAFLLAILAKRFCSKPLDLQKWRPQQNSL